MRLLLELAIAAALIAVAWERSWKERASDLPWFSDKLTTPSKTPARPQTSTVHPRPAPTPTVSGSWMWDPNRKAPLDPPSKTHPTATPH